MSEAVGLEKNSELALRAGAAARDLGHGLPHQLGRFGRLVELGLVAAMAVAALDVACTGARGTLSPSTALLRPIAAFGLLAALATLGAWLLFGLARLALRAVPRLERCVQRALATVARRARLGVARLHAELVVALLSLGAAGTAFRVPLRLADDLQSQSAKAGLLLAGAVLVAALALGLQRALGPGAHWLFVRVQRRFGLPLPRPAWAWWLAYGVLPTALALGLAGRRLGEQLGSWMLLPAGAAWLALFWELRLLAAALGDRLPRALVSVGRWGLRATCWTALFAGSWSLQVPSAMAASRLSAVSVGVLQELTDVDGDGSSSAFGQSDCEPFDGDVYPGARELAGNGQDEDCDGRDVKLPATVARKGPVFSGALPQGAARRFNVVLVVVDSLRADHTSAYGYRYDTTPYLSQLAGKAWVFERAYSQATNTSLSLPSLASGRDPGSFDWKQGRNYPQPKQELQGLPHVFKSAGYYTAVSLNHRMSTRIPSVKQGYEDVLVTPKAADWNSADYTAANAVTALERAARTKRPFFLFLHFDGVHTPYVGGKGRALPAFENPIADVSDYDRGIAQVDHSLRTLVGVLKARDLWDDTVLVFTADHGEAFGEHGETLHSTSCHRETVHVPLVVYVPGQPSKRIATPVALTDVAPTLLELVGAKDALPNLDGQSLLVPTLTPELADPARPIFCTVYQLVKRKKDFFIRSVRRDGVALMHEFLSSRTELYDLEADPNELRDLSSDPAYAELEQQLLSQVIESKRSNVLETRRGL